MLKKTALKITASLCLVATPLASLEAQGLFDIVKNALNSQNGDQNNNQSNLGIFNESQNGDSNDTGALVGCGAFGGIAALVIKGPLGKILGAGIGCFVGWKLGKALTTKRDKEALTTKSMELLASSDAPADTVMTAPDSRQQIRIQTGAPSQIDQYETSFVQDKGIQAPPRGSIVSPATYVVSVPRMNFRSSPTVENDSNIIGYFSKKEKVEVMGFTPDRRWVLLGDDGVLVGYAALNSGKTALMVPEGTKLPTAGPRKPVRAKPKMVKNASTPATAVGTVRVASADNLKVSKVNVTTSCKAVVASAGSASNTHKGCALPNGAWAIS